MVILKRLLLMTKVLAECRVDKTYGKASEDWLAGFLIRSKSLSIRKPEQTSQAIARATGFNKPVVDSFYDKLQSLNTIRTNSKPMKYLMGMKQATQLLWSPLILSQPKEQNK